MIINYDKEVFKRNKEDDEKIDYTVIDPVKKGIEEIDQRITEKQQINQHQKDNKNLIIIIDFLLRI